MEDEPHPESSALAGWRAGLPPASGGEAPVAATAPARWGATEARIRLIAKRKGEYTGPIVALTRSWVSRDSKMHVFAARFLDFAMLTPEHLMLCSTGFFSRRPRHQVLLEPLNRLVVVPSGPEPVRTLRIHGDFKRALVLQLRTDDDSLEFARELLARTRRDPHDPAPAPPPPPSPPSSDTETPAS